MLIQKKLSVLMLALALGFSSVSSSIAQSNPAPAVASTAAASTATATASTASQNFGLPDFTPIVEKTEDAVVNIRTEEFASSRSRGFDGFSFNPNNPDDLFRFFFGPDFMDPMPRPDMPNRPPRAEKPKKGEKTVPSGVGSGFIISSDGYIITNAHVIAEADKVVVTLNNGKEYTAKVIGSDEKTDIALLKIDAKGLKAIAIGNSDHLKKGQWVLAIGSPYDLESTVTSGIVSAINRDTGDYLPFIQTDVAINPGNSGGPLIDLSGEVIGVNSQIYTRSGGFMGISFSIPINDAMRVVDQLKATGTVERGRIGVMISEVQKEVADALGLKDTKGALVSNVEPNSPAEKAGIKSGDVILSFAGQSVNKWSDLPRLVGLTKPGTTSDIQVWRRGKSVNLKITLDSSSGKKAAKAGKDGAEAGKTDRLGLAVSELDDETQEKLRVSNGVVVDNAEGLAADIGIQKGAVIVAVNDQDITSVEQYHTLVKKLPADKAAALLIRREDLTQWVTVTPSK